MLIDRFFQTNYRVPSRLVRYGIVYGSAARDALDEYEPKVDAKLKAQAELLVEHLTNFIEACEALDEQIDEARTGPSEATAKEDQVAKPTKKKATKK